jgi:hypothetical protein
MTVKELMQKLQELITEGKLDENAGIVDAEKYDVENNVSFPIGKDENGQYIIIRA